MNHTSISYRVYYPDDNKVYVSRNVTIIEPLTPSQIEPVSTSGNTSTDESNVSTDGDTTVTDGEDETDASMSNTD